MNTDYQNLLNKYTSELSQVEKQITINEAKITEGLQALNLTSTSELPALKEKLEAEQAELEAKVNKLIAELNEL